MLELASFSTYLSERAAALRGKRAAQILSDRLFRQSRAHEQMSAKPILPGARVIGQGFSVPRGVTVGGYFGVNTYNIERARITSELTGRYSVPAALDVIPIHRYDEPRVQVYTDMPQYMRRQAEQHNLIEARSMLAHSPGVLHMQVSFPVLFCGIFCVLAVSNSHFLPSTPPAENFQPCAGLSRSRALCHIL